MKLYIRTDVNKHVGIGHLSRCSRIIKYFTKKSFTCEMFLDQPSSVDYFFLNKFNSVKINYLYNKKENFINQKEDARRFLSLTPTPGIVIIDDYRINFIWEKIIYFRHTKTVAIEDINNKKHYCNFIINSNPQFINRFNYKNYNMNPKGKLLLGPKYSILNFKRKKKINKGLTITFYLGGSGNLIYFYNIIKDLSFKKKFKIIIVIGPLSKNKKKILKLFKNLKHLSIVENCKDIDNILSKTSILVSSAGMISLESSRYQIPSILFQISDNQIVPNFYLEKLGMYFNLKKKHIFKKKKIVNLILNISNKLKKVKKNFRPSHIIDGRGIDRIFNYIVNNKNTCGVNFDTKIASIKKKLLLINDKAINKYLFARNLNENRKNSNSLKKIDTLDHYNWWLDTDKEIKILEKKGLKLLFIKNEFKFFKGYKFCINGWVKNDVNLNGLDVLWSLKQNIKELKRKHSKIILLGFAKKNNKFANIHTKYLDYKLYDFNNRIINSFLYKEYKQIRKVNVYINII